MSGGTQVAPGCHQACKGDGSAGRLHLLAPHSHGRRDLFPRPVFNQCEVVNQSYNVIHPPRHHLGCT